VTLLVEATFTGEENEKSTFGENTLSLVLLIKSKGKQLR
jgi:hypothetical protein